MTQVSSQYTDVVKDRVARFVAEAKATDAEHYVKVTARFLAEAEHLFLAHQRHTLSVVEMIKESMPSKLRLYITPVATKMTPLLLPYTRDAHFFEKLANSPAEEACGRFSQIMTGVSHTGNLASAKDMLNATAKMLPTLSALMPDLTQSATTVLQNLVSLGLGEVKALEDASQEILAGAGPVVSGHLACTWNSAASRYVAPAHVMFVALSYLLLWM